jgi:hypothetical protein
MKTLCPFPCDPNLKTWGPCDYGHAAIGFGAAFLPREFQGATLGLFLLYELMRAKPCSSKTAAFLQFGLGYVSGQGVAKMSK